MKDKLRRGPLAALARLTARRGGLAALCYLLALAAWLALGAWNFAADALARADGALAEESIPVGDFQLVDVAPEADGWYATAGGDPQIILDNVDGRVVRTLSYTAEFDGEPREMCLYYTTAAGEPYSQDNRVFPTQAADGSYVYTLPRTALVSLRLDPCSPDENATVRLKFAGGAITLNAADALPAGLDYWLPSWYQAFCLILYPALAAAALCWLRACRRALRPKH